MARIIEGIAIGCYGLVLYLLRKLASLKVRHGLYRELARPVLTGIRDADEEAYERELAREKELASRRNSRRGSAVGFDEDLLQPVSCYGSRSHSRVGSRTQMRTPPEHGAQDSYFGQELADEEYQAPIL